MEAHCLKCGATLPDDAPGGLCPACLLGLAIDSDADTSGPAAAGAPAASYVGARLRYFGDYELLGEIARGGMGIVYRARQLSLNRIVAVKMMKPGLLASEAETARFHAEAEAAAGLQHPGIIAIHEVGEHDGLCYFSMEYVDGHSLAQVVREQPLTLRRAATYVRAIAEAVQFAHERGVLHRDLKPANVIIDAADTPRLTDFGLARRLDRDSRLTDTGAVMGTPCYMSPEQAKGRQDEIGPASDVYSIGAILYELLTGRPPFQADTPVDTALLVISREPMAPRQLNPRLAQDIETICLKCLDKDPRKRYPTARALADDLNRFLKHEPITARRIGWTGRTVRWCRRNPWAATAAVAVTLLAGVATVSAITLRDRLWRSYLEQGRTARLLGDRARSLDALRDAAAIRKSDEVQSELIQTITSPGARLRQVIPRLAARKVASPSSNLIAIAGWDHRRIRRPFQSTDEYVSRTAIEIWDLSTGRLVSAIDVKRQDSSFRPTVAVSPDWSAVIGWFGRTRTTDAPALAWSPATGIRREIACEGRGCEQTDRLIFNPDGSRFVNGGSCDSSGCSAWLVDAASGSGAAIDVGGYPLAFLSNDEILAEDVDQLYRWNLTTSKRVNVSPEGVSLMAMTPDAHVAMLRIGDAFSIWDVRAGRPVSKFPTLAARDDRTEAVLSRDGRIAAVMNWSQSNVVHLYEVGMSKVGYRTITLPPNRSVTFASNQGAFSPDGSLLAAFGGEGGEGSVTVWDIATGQSVASLRGNHSPVWSHDGRLLITNGPAAPDTSSWVSQSFASGRSGAADNAVNIWEISPPTPADVQPTSVGSIAFSPDGTHFLTNGRTWPVRTLGERLVFGSSPVDRAADSAVFVFGDHVWLREPVKNAMLKLEQLAPARSEVIFLDPRYDGVKPGVGQRPRYTDPKAIAFSPDGQRLVVSSTIMVGERGGSSGGGDRALELWDLTTAQRLAVWSDGAEHVDVTALTFSPDGRFIAMSATNIGPGNGLLIRDATTGNEFLRIRTALPKVLTYTPDGRRVIAASFSDGSEVPLFVYDAETGRELGQWKGHRKSVNALAISPDGKMLASAGADRRIALWDLATGRRLAMWDAHAMAVTALAFSRDSRTLASGSADGAVKLWDLPTIRRELGVFGVGW